MYFGRVVSLRATAIAAGAGAVVAMMLAAPVWAHVEVTADNAQAGARGVTLTFVGEAESTTAGIAAEHVVLPAGIGPQDVRLAKAPQGWELTTTEDGFTVAGKALPIGEDATFSVVVAQLPAGVTELAFKTLETYGDGSISRWIEIPETGKAEPDNPAPVLKLKPAAAPAPTTDAPVTAVAVASSADAASSGASASDANIGGWLVAAVVVVLAAVAGAVLLVRRRRQQASPQDR